MIWKPKAKYWIMGNSETVHKTRKAQILRENGSMRCVELVLWSFLFIEGFGARTALHILCMWLHHGASTCLTYIAPCHPFPDRSGRQKCTPRMMHNGACAMTIHFSKFRNSRIWDLFSMILISMCRYRCVLTLSFWSFLLILTFIFIYGLFIFNSLFYI